MAAAVLLVLLLGSAGFLLSWKANRNPDWPTFTTWIAPLALAALGVALLLLRVRILALPLLGIALLLLAWCSQSKRAERTPESADRPKETPSSRVVEIHVDDNTGDISGRILAGSFAGSELANLQLNELRQILQYCSNIDSESEQALRRYLDCAYVNWDSDDDDSGSDDTSVRGGPMTVEDAYRVLGLPLGASSDEIETAYKKLIKEVHPDHGGDSTLARQVIEARAVLLHDASREGV